MAIYQRGKNWYIDFAFKGKRIRESIGPSRKGAEKVIAKKKTEIVENKYLDIRKEPEPVNFYGFSKQYLVWRKTNRKSYSTILSCLTRLNKTFEKKDLHKITTNQVEDYKEKRREQGVKPATINLEMAVLKHLYSKAIEWGKVKENPVKGVSFLSPAKRTRFLMPNEYQKLLSCCSDDLKTIVIIAAHTGMRKSEILNLQWNQVNLELGIITLPDTKAGEEQYVIMDETVWSLLRQLERTGTFLFGGHFKEGKEGQKSRNTLRVETHDAFKATLKKAGIDDIHFHDLRHTAASNLIMQAGVSPYDVQDFLRLKTPAMVKRYAHLAQSYKRSRISKLDKVLSESSPQIDAEMSQNPPQQQIIVATA